jgi:DNA-directed RNA polymerase specialized sigma24 family protein
MVAGYTAKEEQCIDGGPRRRGLKGNDYKDIILAQWSVINAMAVRRFSGPLAEEAALFVLDKLREDDCRRLRAHTGRASLATFIGIVTSRLLEDFARKKFGRLRPPLWLRKLGGIWLQLYDFLCRQRFSVNDAVEMIVSRTTATRERSEEAARTIKARIADCGRHQALEVELAEEEMGPEHVKQTYRTDQEEQMTAAERRLFFSLLLGLELGKERAETLDRLLPALRKVLCLEPEERLLLQMIYRDEVSVRDAGVVLGLNVNQVHGRLRRLLQRIRNDLDKAGLTEELRLLF